MPFEDEPVRVNYDHLYSLSYVPSNNVEDAAVRNPKAFLYLRIALMLRKRLLIA